METNGFQNSLTKALQFTLPDTIYQQQGAGGLRLFSGQFQQGSIIEDDIGRDLFLLGDLLAQPAQLLEQGRVILSIVQLTLAGSSLLLFRHYLQSRHGQL